MSPQYATKLAPAEFENRSVLIITEPQNRPVLVDMCRALSFRQVHWAKSPKDAIGAMRVVTFDFALCKWSSPAHDALRLIACLRASDLPTLKRIPVVLIGEYESADIVGEGGMTEIVPPPPFSIARLAHAFEQVIF